MFDVRSREVERRPRNFKVMSSIPGSRSQLRIFIGSRIRCEYWCSSNKLACLKKKPGEVSITIFK